MGGRALAETRGSYTTDVDRPPLTPTEFASAVTAISSAFGDPTRRDIFLFAAEHPEGITAAEAAQQFDLHPNVARHHLDKLAGGAYLDIDTAPRQGAGRPSKRYRATTSGVNLEFRVAHHDVLVTLLGRALAMLPPEQAEAMAEEVGAEYGKTMAASFGGAGEISRSFRSSLHAVADALTANGFSAHAEKDGDQLRIVSENCPFGGAAIEHPVICAVDRGMVRGMLGELWGEASPALSASLPMGDDVCVTAVDF
jgi:predicted ArsR family transcriptional regulator